MFKEVDSSSRQKIDGPFFHRILRLNVRRFLSLPYYRGEFSGLLTDLGRQKSHSPPLPKTYHTYPARMKHATVIYYLNKTQKYTKHVTQPLSSVDINIFPLEISSFCYIKKYRYRLHLIHNFQFF